MSSFSILYNVSSNSPNSDVSAATSPLTIYGSSEYTIGKGIELCLNELEKYITADRILLISPILLGDTVWKPNKDPEFGIHSIEVCARLKSVYEEIAKRRGTFFLAAGDYVVANDADEEHMDEEGHAALANAVEDAIRKCY